MSADEDVRAIADEASARGNLAAKDVILLTLNRVRLGDISPATAASVLRGYADLVSPNPAETREFYRRAADVIQGYLFEAP